MYTKERRRKEWVERKVIDVKEGKRVMYAKERKRKEKRTGVIVKVEGEVLDMREREREMYANHGKEEMNED